MVQLSLLRSFLLEHLFILIPKVSTIWLRNSSDPIGFPLEITELLTWHTFPCISLVTYYLFQFDYFFILSNSIFPLFFDKKLSPRLAN